MAATGPAAGRRWTPWVNGWTGVSVPGTALAILWWGPLAAVAVATTVAAIMVLIMAVAEPGTEDAGARPGTAPGFWALRIVVCAAVMAVSTTAWMSLSPALALALVLLGGATLPPSVDVIRRMSGHGVRAASPTPAPSAAGVVPDSAESSRRSADVITARWMARRLDVAAGEMSDTELYQAWRRSFWSLRRARTPVERLAVVLQRESFLDAFELRDERALRQWLASGASASTGPEHFATRQSDQSRDQGER